MLEKTAKYLTSQEAKKELKVQDCDLAWNMVVKGTPYINPEGYLFLDQKRKLGLVKRIKKQIDKFALTNSDLNLTTN